MHQTWCRDPDGDRGLLPPAGMAGNELGPAVKTADLTKLLGRGAHESIFGRWAEARWRRARRGREPLSTPVLGLRWFCDIEADDVHKLLVGSVQPARAGAMA